MEQEEHQPSPPKKKPVEDPEVTARRLAAEDAARRKEQEDKDAELARRLDLELNMDDPPATSSTGNRTGSGPPMPGAWGK